MEELQVNQTELPPQPEKARRGGGLRPAHGRDKDFVDLLPGHTRREQFRLPFADRGQVVVNIIRVSVPDQKKSHTGSSASCFPVL